MIKEKSGGGGSPRKLSIANQVIISSGNVTMHVETIANS
jgi:hypothetical protein